MNVESGDFFTQPEGTNYCKFYRQWVRNNYASEKEGREVGEEKDFILIICPGQDKQEVRRKVTEQDKRTYAGQWAAYQEGKESQIQGTPIDLLPNIPVGMSDVLKSLYVYSIEQLANLSDLALQRVGMGGVELRKRAQEFLAGGKGDMEAAKRRIAELEERIRELEAQPRPGRPRKGNK